MRNSKYTDDYVRYKIQDIGQKPQNTKYKIQNKKTQNTKYKMQGIGLVLLVAGGNI